jgi:aldehyde:ferredoxin oxidoreductase
MESKKLFGYSGKIARIDLSSGRITVEEPPGEFYQRLLGGRGFTAAILLKELKAGLDPLGPDNRLIFALGPLTGMPLSGGGRNSIGAKSPLTGGFGESEVGGYWGAELKKAGFDALIFQGASSKPVYLWVNDGELELRDAAGLWGLEVAQAEKAIHSELGDDKIRTAIIGPAGERLVSFASIINDISHAAGRCGMGAVMGSKKLKAVAVRGNHLPDIADAKRLQEIAKWMAQHYKEGTELWRHGTGLNIIGYNLGGNLPTKNFSVGFFDGAEKIGAQEICEQYGVGMHTCYACSVRCKKNVKLESPWTVDPIYGGPEYETIGAFGSNCLSDDVPAICKAHEICNRFGMDTISAGVTIAFAMECFENGYINQKDTGGLELKFGNSEAMIAMLERIGNREGLGDLLARGSRKAAEAIGKGSKEFAMHVKGMEIPMHEPRLKQGQGLHFSVNASGADHSSGSHDTLFAHEGKLLENWREVDYADPVIPGELNARKARFMYQTGWFRSVGNIIGLCNFVPYSPGQVSDAVKAVTGWPMSIHRLMKTTERSMMLCRIFNLREGFTKSDDRLPKRFETGLKEGAVKGVIIDPDKLEDAKKAYYRMLGWDEDGVPTHAGLAELDIEWAQEYIPRGKR